METEHRLMRCPGPSEPGVSGQDTPRQDVALEHRYPPNVHRKIDPKRVTPSSMASTGSSPGSHPIRLPLGNRYNFLRKKAIRVWNGMSPCQGEWIGSEMMEVRGGKRSRARPIFKITFDRGNNHTRPGNGSVKDLSPLECKKEQDIDPSPRKNHPRRSDTFGMK
ncbi:hypothetical protein Q8A67_015260 [Cirrhinus molitorella]|uniref:Uncharacterized protein n=1 Tax=Cirrhinus molitorella TaxID=172907 RepID=A0AA88TT84_9TELE|nr:hypothetical protein Q8A67_015260 [Cirrhinus molitorella]